MTETVQILGPFAVLAAVAMVTLVGAAEVQRRRTYRIAEEERLTAPLPPARAELTDPDAPSTEVLERVLTGLRDLPLPVQRGTLPEHRRLMAWRETTPLSARQRFERTVVESFAPGTVPIFEQLERDMPDLLAARDRALRTPTMEINLVFDALVSAFDWSCSHCLDGDHVSCVGCECECTLAAVA